MNLFNPRKLQTKFFLGLAVIMAVMGVFFITLLQMHLRQNLEQEVRSKAQLILSNVDTLQHSVQALPGPGAQQGKSQVACELEAMSSSSISRAVMDLVGKDLKQFRFRRVAESARNPDFEADPLERELLARFRADPKLASADYFRKDGDQDTYILAQPVVLQASCLRCHGDPASAPREILDNYGSERGFWRHEGDLVGAHVVSLPVEGGLSRIRGATLAFVSMFSVGALLLFGAINVYFNRLVVHNLSRTLSVMRRHFPEQAAGAGVASPVGGEDEIEQVLASVEDFAASLRQARGQLESYAANLETMVAGRTAQLTQEAEARRADVSLFVGLLGSLNHSRSRKELMDTCLALICVRFGAVRVSYSCTMAAGESYTWPERVTVANGAQAICHAEIADAGGGMPQPSDTDDDQGAGHDMGHDLGHDAGLETAPARNRDRADAPQADLPPDWHQLVADGVPRFSREQALIPVQTSEVARGLLTVTWNSGQTADEQAVEVLMAVGQQLGIVMENLEALDGLLRQNDTLQSIFEGITDPLALLDGTGRVVLANESARTLAQAGQHGQGPEDGESRGETQESSKTADGGPDGEKPDDQKPGGRFLRRALGIAAGDPLPVAMLETPSVREVCLPGERRFMLFFYPLPEYREHGGRLVAYGREVTAERRMLEEAQQNEKLLAVGRLAAGLAHEINNPLGVILCYAELLKGITTDPQGRQDVDIILKHTRQAQKVLGDLLGFVRPRKAAQGLCDLPTVARQQVMVFSPQAEAGRVALFLDAADTLPPVPGDPAALEQILSNLLINALHAAPVETGVITVSTGLAGDRAFLRVADNGPGIPEENRSLIFDPFFTTKAVGRGTGLGLAVVFSLVKDMLGTVEARNNGGAEFTVWLPLARQCELHPAKGGDRAAA